VDFFLLESGTARTAAKEQAREADGVRDVAAEEADRKVDVAAEEADRRVDVAAEEADRKVAVEEVDRLEEDGTEAEREEDDARRFLSGGVMSGLQKGCPKRAWVLWEQPDDNKRNAFPKIHLHLEYKGSCMCGIDKVHVSTWKITNDTRWK
jgi:hypothetical protein